MGRRDGKAHFTIFFLFPYPIPSLNLSFRRWISWLAAAPHCARKSAHASSVSNMESEESKNGWVHVCVGGRYRKRWTNRGKLVSESGRSTRSEWIGNAASAEEEIARIETSRLWCRRQKSPRLPANALATRSHFPGSKSPSLSEQSRKHFPNYQNGEPRIFKSKFCF